MILMSNYYELVKGLQKDTGIKQIICTNIKETLPPLLRILFTLAKEKKGGFRVTLRDNDLWMPDLLAKYQGREQPQVEVGPEDTAIFQYSGGTTGIPKGEPLACTGIWLPTRSK